MGIALVGKPVGVNGTTPSLLQKKNRGGRRKRRRGKEEWGEDVGKKKENKEENNRKWRKEKGATNSFQWQLKFPLSSFRHYYQNLFIMLDEVALQMTIDPVQNQKSK